MGLICSIHQPNFCPYAGVFQKIEQSDIFVILNHVQFEKNGYQNRFHHDNKWYTMRVNQSHRPIIEKEYLYHEEDWKKISDKFPKLKDFSGCITESLAMTNVQIIQMAMYKLKIHTPLRFDYPTELTGTARLVDLCKYHGATTYLSGTGGKNYLDVSLFDKEGIKVIIQQNPDKRALVELL